MFRYSMYGLVIASEIELPDLPETKGDPDVQVRLATVPRIAHRATATEEYVFNSDSGVFLIRNGREILLDRQPGGTPHGVRVLLLGRVMAFLLRQRGWLPLHASGVLVDNRAVLFLGPSGTGKSTTAAAFHSRGHMVITDDVGAVRASPDAAFVQPGGSRVRLLEDSRLVLELFRLQSEFQLDKHSYNLPGTRVDTTLPLSRIYVIEQGDRFEVAPLNPVVGAALLSRHSFIKRRSSETDVVRTHLRQCAEVAGVTPIRRLIRPLSLSLIPDLVRTVENDLSESG